MHVLVVKCVCRRAGECTYVGYQVYISHGAGERTCVSYRVNISHGAGECICVGFQVCML